MADKAKSEHPLATAKRHGHAFAKAKDDKDTYECQRPACGAKADKNGKPKT